MKIFNTIAVLGALLHNTNAIEECGSTINCDKYLHPFSGDGKCNTLQTSYLTGNIERADLTDIQKQISG